MLNEILQTCKHNFALRLSVYEDYEAFDHDGAKLTSLASQSLTLVEFMWFGAIKR